MTLLAVLVVACHFRVTGRAEELHQRFTDPPEEAKPWVYWFWMNGNVTKEGITADLEAMNRIGIGGALMMNVGLRTPPGPYDFNTPEWRELYSHAADECVRLGMKLTLHALDGWATSGGPWIRPEQSMKLLVWSTVEISGPSNGAVHLDQPFTREDFYEDVAVVAVPLTEDEPLRPDRVTVNGGPGDPLFDGDLKTGVSGEIEVVAGFDEPVEVSSVVFPRATRWPYALSAGADVPTTIEVSEDGNDFEKVAEFDYNLSIDNGDHFSLTASFPERKARAVRIRMDNKRPIPIVEIELRSRRRVHLWEAKSSLAREREHGGETPWLDAAPWPGAFDGTDPGEIIDLTGRLAANGMLDWKVPEGRWRIIRVGMTSTGKHVAPRTNADEGLEADKMSGEAIRHHWNSFGKAMVEENNIAPGNPIWSTHTDSWESALHTWSSYFAREFEKRRGYSMVPWLPVLTTGAVIGSARESERFLWDYRRTCADLIADNFHGEMKRLANGAGLLYQSEAAGRQMFMYDPLNYAAQTDMYVGEFWMPGNVRVDCKVAASAAHTHGRPFAAAEAWTSGDGGFRDAPFDWKPLGDHAFTVGINRVIIHRYCMQPFDNVEPGMTFGPYGINFERTQTFWENGGKAWIEYLTRCQSLLQAGTFVADVIHYIGHDAPNYLGHRDELWNPVPPGYDYDGCNLEILKQLAVERDGALILPSGMRYRVLLLPNREHMTLEAAREVERLVDAGATVVGGRPLRTPGLANWRENDAELAEITSRCWGRVLDETLETVLGRIVPPDFDYDAPEGVKINYIHRRLGDDDVYFVASADSSAPVDTVLRFRVAGRQPELWDASTGDVRSVGKWREMGGVTEFPVHFDPAGSWFVVFREKAASPGWEGAGKAGAGSGADPPIEAGAPDDFTMALWLKSVAEQELPPEGTRGVKPGGNNYAVYPVPGHEVWSDKDAGVGICAGKGGLMVIGHGARYFAPLIVHSADLSEWTHVAVTARGGALTLYLDGEPVAASSAPGRPLRASIGVGHARSPAPFDGATASPYQTAEPLDEGGVKALMERTEPKGAQRRIELAGPWTLAFPSGRQAPDSVELPELVSWTEHSDEGVKYFSGTATYRKTFRLSEVDGCWLLVDAAGESVPHQLNNVTTQQLFLDFGEVRNIAEVTLNGKDLGILWKPPFKVDVSDALVEGENVLEVRVTNLWPNRLIGDARLHPDPGLDYHPQGPPWAAGGPLQSIPDWVRDGGSSPAGRTTFVLWKFYGGDETLLPSGLIGPVGFVTGNRKPEIDNHEQ